MVAASVVHGTKKNSATITFMVPANWWISRRRMCHHCLVSLVFENSSPVHTHILVTKLDRKKLLV